MDDVFRPGKRVTSKYGKRGPRTATLPSIEDRGGAISAAVPPLARALVHVSLGRRGGPASGHNGGVLVTTPAVASRKFVNAANGTTGRASATGKCAPAAAPSGSSATAERASVLMLMRRRETGAHTYLQRCSGSAPPMVGYTHTPARFTVRMTHLLRGCDTHTDAMPLDDMDTEAPGRSVHGVDPGACVFLGFLRCAQPVLVSYSTEERVTDAAHMRMSVELQLWRLHVEADEDATEQHSMHGRGGGSGPRHRLRLHARVPLFDGADWGPYADVEGTSVRVALWEPPDAGCIVAVGLPARPSGPQPCYITVVPDAWSLLTTSRTATLVEACPGVDVIGPSGDGAPVLFGAVSMSSYSHVRALHLHVMLMAPYPRPSQLGLWVDDAAAATYALCVNTGDGLRFIRFRVQPVGITSSDAQSAAAPAAPLAGSLLQDVSRSAPVRHAQVHPRVVTAVQHRWCAAPASSVTASTGAPATSVLRGTEQVWGQSALGRVSNDVLGHVHVCAMLHLDAEALLRRIVKGEVRNYDLRIVTYLEAGAAAAWRIQEDASSGLLLCMILVDHAMTADAAVTVPPRSAVSCACERDRECTCKALVPQTAPLTRSQLLFTVCPRSWCVRVVKLARLPPGAQPAFDAARASSGAVRSKTDRAVPGQSLASLAASAVNSARARVYPRVCTAALTREMANDALLHGRSLTKLLHPALPIAVLA